MSARTGWHVRLRRAARLCGYVTATLLVLFGAWWAGFAGFLMPSQMHLQVSFGQYQGIGMSVLGAVDIAAILLLRRPRAWLVPAVSGAALMLLQLARLAVFGRPYLDTGWWVTVGAVTVPALCAAIALRIGPGHAADLPPRP
ncbi:MAG: hypothetical protein IPK28_17085 [Devosia sp.]|nr:hypothetical protein [Devosia sp.]